MGMMKYLPQRKADENQAKALAKMRGKKVFALLLAMRMRKSKILIDDFGEMELSGKVQDFCVIAPNGVIRTWVTAMQEHLSDDLRERLLVHLWQSGSGKGLERARTAFLTEKGGPRALLMNVEALSRPGDARVFIKAFLAQRDNVVGIDECFPAGTMISTPFGQRAIETLKVGDLVTSSFSNERIKTIIRNKAKVLSYVKLSNGATIVTTPNHPFFTDLGWVNAEDLEGRVLHDINKKEVRDLRKAVREKTLTCKNQKWQREILRKILLSEMEDRPSRMEAESRLVESCPNARKQSEWFSYEREEWLVEGREKNQEKNEYDSYRNGSNCSSQQSDQQSPQSIRTSTSDTWKGTESISRDVDENFRAILEGGIFNCSWKGFDEKWLPSSLYGGPGSSSEKISYRMRRQKPQQYKSKSKGQKEGKQVGGIRVESIKTIRLRNPINVFNLELEGCPHYFAENVLVHNCTIIKNNSERTKFIIKFVKPVADYRRILSGLPTPRAPLDLFFQFAFLDEKILGFNSYWTFRAHIAILKQQWFGGRSVMLIDKDQGNNGYRPEATKELQRLIAPHSFRVPFRPKVPSTYSIREVEMTPEQKKAYHEMKEFATTQLANEAHITATVVIAQMMRMHQILCGHVKDEQGSEHLIPENKTAALLELLEDVSCKVIIWCSYDIDVRKVSAALMKEYGKSAVSRFWGGNVKTREAEVHRFKTDPACRFNVTTPDSGGKGQTWDMADLAVYYSSKDNLEHRDQSEQRTMGRDKTRGVDIVDLVCPDTIEWRRDGGPSILMALRNKLSMASAITGDNYKSWLI